VARSFAARAHFSPGAIMALPARFSLLHSDLNDFLFAPVGEEQNGVTLSVVSALTRLGVDPWEEAARLSIRSTTPRRTSRFGKPSAVKGRISLLLIAKDADAYGPV
jgi:hypothetical protein